MPWASSTFYQSLLREGIRIFEYTPSMLHAKYLVLDDWVIVGSSNLNHRSLLHDLEVDVNIKSDQAKQELEEQFLKDTGNSNEVTLQTWKPRPLPIRLMGKLLLYLKYWI